VERTGDDALLAGMPPRLQVPHSRRNEVPQGALAAKGYRILSQFPGGGVDLFARPGRSLFVFAQGHPEYSAETLGREYLRDIGRFLRGEDEAPAIPENYFDRMTEDRLADLGARATDEGDLPRYNAVVLGAVPLLSWRSHTLKLFGNWLAGIAAEKMHRVARKPLPGRARKRA
jgi:homoserine O-succinyltransferase